MGLRVAVGSGKGGTGKTTVAVNLSFAIPGPVALLDCDVEEPNCHIFLKPKITWRDAVAVPVPAVDMQKCTLCGLCSEACEYGAIAVINTGPKVFPELCHGCGGCAKVCPTGAITETKYEIGWVETGKSGPVTFAQGRLKVGQAMGAPVIRAVKRHAPSEGTTIIDCPPGTSCPLLASVKGADYVVLVAEPTPFGLNDLALSVETMRKLGLNFGVVINRADVGDSRVTDYCRREGIAVLLEIPDDRRIAEAYSRGKLLVEALPEIRGMLLRLNGFLEGLRTPATATGRES